MEYSVTDTTAGFCHFVLPNSFRDEHSMNIVHKEALFASASKIQGHYPGPVPKVSEECVVYVILRRTLTWFSEKKRDLCSVLTQMRSFSWSHHCESHSIATRWCSCALNGCSEAVPTHSLASMRTHLVFRGVFNTHSLVFTCTHKRSGCVQYVFSLFMHLKAQWICFQILQKMQRPYKLALNFHWMPFLWLCQARRHDVTLEYMIGGRSRCPPMRLATKIRKYCKKLEN